MQKVCLFKKCKKKKAFFCQPFFEKIQTLHFLFQNGFFFEKTLFVSNSIFVRKHFRKPSFDKKRNRLYSFTKKEYKNKK